MFQSISKVLSIWRRFFVILASNIEHKTGYSSIGQFIFDSAKQHANEAVLQVKVNQTYSDVYWSDLVNDIQKLMQFFLNNGAKPGQRVIFFTPNSREMLTCELAVMALGMVAVPLFFGYKETRVNDLIAFSEGDFLVVPNEQQLKLINPSYNFSKIIHFMPVEDNQLQETYSSSLSFYDDIIQHSLSVNQQAKLEQRVLEVDRHSPTLLMYTSGTMSLPKGVQLTHGNILSQQEALHTLWQTQRGDTILSYLPWHHSFGGIFELFFALYSGTTMVLDDSKGKNIELLVENWTKILPNYFFSVPKVFLELVTLAMTHPEMDSIIFHKDLKFVFTAGAPLASNISDYFAEKNIPVLEGWGLTETSPCCTLTDGLSKREPGLVGKPIPGVSIKLSDDNEILVKGPNIMTGYFHNIEATKNTFDEEGWFKTGDLGDVSEKGVKIISRKDRIFKLLSAEKVNPTGIENSLLGKCALLKHVLVFGSGMKSVNALIFPNKEGLINDACRDTDGCERPTDIKDFSCCLNHCVTDINNLLIRKYESIKTFIIIDHELDIEKGELTPSMKMNPNTVFNNYYSYIEALDAQTSERPQDAIYVDVSKI